MSTLELLQLQNEHKDNFFGKGEENIKESEDLKNGKEKKRINR